MDSQISVSIGKPQRILMYVTPTKEYCYITESSLSENNQLKQSSPNEPTQGQLEQPDSSVSSNDDTNESRNSITISGPSDNPVYLLIRNYLGSKCVKLLEFCYILCYNYMF